MLLPVIGSFKLVLDQSSVKWSLNLPSTEISNRIHFLTRHFRVKNVNLINVVRRKAQIEELKARYGSDTHVVVFDGSNEDEALAEVNAITQNKGVNYGKYITV